jgi:hypothetical protein
MRAKIGLFLGVVSAVATLVALTVATSASAATAAAQPPSGLTATVTGTCSFLDATTGQVVNGTITNGLVAVTGFSSSGGQLFANGTITGTCTAVNTLGQTVTQSINGTFSTLVTGATGSCTILHLTLGPIHLDLLGLVVDTNQIVIDISAHPGSGNLLGNLLCGIANALNTGQTSSQLATLLNQLLAIL